MSRTRLLTVLTLTLVLGGVFAMLAQAAEGPQRGSRRGGFSRDSLLGLLRLEQVQKEMKLTPEQTAKVNEIAEKLGTEVREKYAALREIEDRAERRTKTEELRDQIDDQLRDQLRDVVSREQMMRLYQIRMQVRPAAESLANPYVARRLELTEEQQKKVAEVAKEAQEKQSELFAKMRNAGDQERSEAFQKLRQIRSEADEKALAVLTDEQKEAFEKMKGEKIELERGRRGR